MLQIYPGTNHELWFKQAASCTQTWSTLLHTASDRTTQLVAMLFAFAGWHSVALSTSCQLSKKLSGLKTRLRKGHQFSPKYGYVPLPPLPLCSLSVPSRKSTVTFVGHSEKPSTTFFLL